MAALSFRQQVMARRRKPHESRDWLFPKSPAAESAGESSLLDALDTVLNRGAVLNGDIVLGVANVDLVYVKLSALLAAFDKAMNARPPARRLPAAPKKTRRR
jgi:hypothetical protein